MKPERLSEAELIAETGVSHRNLTRWRQQGLVLPEEQRHGLGQGPRTTQLEYPAVAVAIIKRIIELRRNFKKVDEWRWRLWLEGYPVRIAPRRPWHTYAVAIGQSRQFDVAVAGRARCSCRFHHLHDA